MYWKSEYDIIGVNICQLIDRVGLAPVFFFQESIMHLIAINQGPALPNNFLAQKCMII